jgi:hypothetical protein
VCNISRHVDTKTLSRQDIERSEALWRRHPYEKLEETSREVRSSPDRTSEILRKMIFHRLEVGYIGKPGGIQMPALIY